MAPSWAGSPETLTGQISPRTHLRAREGALHRAPWHVRGGASKSMTRSLTRLAPSIGMAACARVRATPISGVWISADFDDMEGSPTATTRATQANSASRPDPAPSFSTVGSRPGLEHSVRLAHAVVREDRGQSEGRHETHHDRSEKGAPLPSVVFQGSQDREAHTYRLVDSSPENLRQQREGGGTATGRGHCRSLGGDPGLLCSAVGVHDLLRNAATIRDLIAVARSPGPHRTEVAGLRTTSAHTSGRPPASSA
jgi:hypothetical protein